MSIQITNTLSERLATTVEEMKIAGVPVLNVNGLSGFVVCEEGRGDIPGELLLDFEIEDKKYQLYVDI